MQNDGRERVGIIGLGIIGSRVAELLQKTDRNVYVWNRTPRPVPNFVASAGELAQLSKIIQIFVTDGEALVEVVESMKEHLGKGHVVIAHGTSDPQSVVDAFQIARDAGAAFLDAPFTGSREAAEKGALVYYIGGDPAVLDRVRPLLEVSAKEILPLGRVGEASVLKIATNMISASTMEILAEAYGLVTAAGIEPRKLEEAIEHNGCCSPLIRMKLSSVMRQDYEPHFSLQNMFKDAQYGLGLGKGLGVDLPNLSTTANLIFRSIQKGKGDFDFSVLASNYQVPEENDVDTEG